MAAVEKKMFTKSLQGKVIAIFFITSLSIALSWIVTRIAFRKMVITIEEVSKPNDKLRILNGISKNIGQIDQLQRKQTLQNPDRAYPILLPESQQLLKALDTLRSLSTENTQQLQQIDSMKNIIYKHDVLLIRYLKLYSSLIDNKKLSKKFRSLSDFISGNAFKTDSSVVTTEKKTTTTTIIPNETTPKAKKEEKQLSFFKRLFGKKKNETEKPQSTSPSKIVKEELNVRIDTLAVAQQDSLIKEVEASIQNIDQYQRFRNAKFSKNELELLRYENESISQLHSLLRTIEEEEIIKIKNNDSVLIDTVNSSMDRILLIMILFFIITAILIFLIFTDISRSNMYRKQLLIAKEEAEYLSTVKQRFLSNMSHEIRTPLQSIIGFSEQIMQQEKPQRDAVNAIHHSSEHLLQIVNEVLDYSRIISGKFIFENHVFDMGLLLAEVAETMRLQASAKNIQFIFNTITPLGKLYSGDSFRLKQILYNLLGNAIKFTNTGSVALEIHTTDKDNKTEFLFQITDTGIGLSTNNLNTIFNEFEQADSTVHSKHGGTGLGLSIVKSLVDQQHGTITVSSELQKGSVFSVTLIYPKTDELKLVDSKHEQDEKIIFPGKVLVIDDDAFILKLCSDILKKHAIPHTCEISSEAVLNNTWDDTITVVLMDIRMPTIDGTELCKLLRKKIKTDVKIAALTAQVLPEEQSIILQQGFDGLITKPFKESDIISWLNSTIANKKKRGGIDDTSYIVKMSMGDNSLLKNNLNSFISETLLDLKNLAYSLEQKNKNEIIETLHKLAGRIGQVGATALSYKLRIMERTLNEMQITPEKIKEMNELIEEMNQLVNGIQTDLKNN